MIPPSTWAAVLRTDGLRLVRDRFLVGALVYLVSTSLVLRWLLPWLHGELQQRFGFDLEAWYPLLVGYYAVVMASLLMGMIGGFLLLESREDRTIHALAVGPLPLEHYLLIVGVALSLLTFALSLAQFCLIGLALPRGTAVLLACSTASPASALIALFIGTAADNKVEAFAQMKFLSAVGLLPVATWFLEGPWQWLGGLYPPFWAVKGYWLAQAEQPGWSVLPWLSLVLTLVPCWWLGRRFSRAL